MTPTTKSDQKPTFFRMPQTATGWSSLWLGTSFVVLFAMWLLYVGMTAPMSRPTFFSDPVHAVLILSAAGAAVGGAIAGLLALFTRSERSVMVMLSVVPGGFVLYWAIAEIFGH